MKIYALFGLVIMAAHITCGITYAQEITNKNYYCNGVEYEAQGNFLMAQGEFEKALELDPFFGPAEFCLKTINNVKEEKIKRETFIYLFRCVSYNNKGEYDKDIRDYTKAIEINPKFESVYDSRGIAYDV